MMRTFAIWPICLLWMPLAGGTEVIRYEGSSTIANYIADAGPIYGEVVFEVATHSESAGGEQCVIARTCDLAGVARAITPGVFESGAVATRIGQDAIGVVVHPSNPLRAIDSSTLARIFTGRIELWSEIGGRDIPIEPLVTAPRSATHRVFRDRVLAGGEYAGVRIVEPDARIVSIVSRETGATGQISFSFLKYGDRVRALDVDGQHASVQNSAYPMARPLYFLTPGEPRGAVRKFIDWTLGPVGQAILRGRFVGAN